MPTDTRQWFAFGGSALLILGVFAPIISVPLAGSLNFYNNGQSDGVIVLIAGVIALIISALKRYRWLWLAIVPSAFAIGFDFFNLQRGLMQGDSALKTVQIQWGWAVLLLGVAALVIAAIQRAPVERDA